MKNKIKVRDRTNLLELIKTEIEHYGTGCDLNHLDVSDVRDMSYVFLCSEFNGDISKWDVSNVKDMSDMFSQSDFNGDISNWDVSNVIEMSGMFTGSNFNRDISKWDVSNVKSMEHMFDGSCFLQDLNSWKPVNVLSISEIFNACKAPIPYWAKFQNNEQIRNAIELFELYGKLKLDLNVRDESIKKSKI